MQPTARSVVTFLPESARPVDGIVESPVGRGNFRKAALFYMNWKSAVKRRVMNEKAYILKSS
jgi:hypothetical protein